MATEKKIKTMTDVRSQLYDNKKDTNPMGNKFTQTHTPTQTDRLMDAYRKDPTTIDTFFKSPVGIELLQIITEMELHDTRSLLDITGKPDITDRLRGQVAGYRRILCLLTMLKDKFKKPL